MFYDDGGFLCKVVRVQAFVFFDGTLTCGGFQFGVVREGFDDFVIHPVGGVVF